MEVFQQEVLTSVGAAAFVHRKQGPVSCMTAMPADHTFHTAAVVVTTYVSPVIPTL